MSWSQKLHDRGIGMGMLGEFHAPNNTGKPTDPFLRKNLEFIREQGGGSMGAAVLTAEHESRRICGLADSVRLQQSVWSWPLRVHDLLIAKPASGVFLTRADMMMRRIQTICMPVDDHPVISVQVVGGNRRVLACAMLRATEDRTHGKGSVIETFFEVLAAQELQGEVYEIHFYLSAGRGPCCFPDEGKYLQSVARKFSDLGHIFSDEHEFRGYDAHTGRFGVSMLRILAAEINRCGNDAGKACVIHRRDNDCTTCPDENGLMPYFSRQCGKLNLAYFRTELEIPQRLY